MRILQLFTSLTLIDAVNIDMQEYIYTSLLTSSAFQHTLLLQQGSDII